MKNKKLYLIGLGLLALSVLTPFIIDIFNPWPSIKRLGATMVVIGLVFSSSLAYFLKKKEDFRSH